MIIKTKGFILRYMKMSDLDKYYESVQDKLTKKGFMQVIKNKSEAKKELKYKISDYSRKKPFGIAFAIEINGEFAGYVELHHLNQKYFEHKGEIGYCMHPNFRGKGIMSKAVRLVTNYAFKKYKLKRMTGTCRTFNKASARVLEKAGYKLEGILKKNKYRNGRYLDDMVWAKIK